ncbi:MAG: hypothetical protein HRT68_02215 [Flavobacteriaceae bacterium]|nr:hypothetical protein [Flavobacteriaceae bacterium]
MSVILNTHPIHSFVTIKTKVGSINYKVYAIYKSEVTSIVTFVDIQLGFSGLKTGIDIVKIYDDNTNELLKVEKLTKN